MKKWIAAVGIALSAAASPAWAGIPVIDVAALVQAVQEVMNSVTQISHQVTQITNQYQQIQQMAEQLQSINGMRGLLNVANNPQLRDYIPQSAAQTLQDINSNGYGSLQGAARAARDAGMVYNCLEIGNATERNTCQAQLAQPFQIRQYINDAMQRASQRMSQIEDLRVSAGATDDQKAIQEAQARIGVEQAMLLHELSQVQLLANRMKAEEAVQISRSKERLAAQATKTTRPGALPW
jgi:type IV secretion system protein VirB5